ncbi:MAG TPA: DUF3443 family protein [Acidobacteriaceae bacterium]|nr:DUF3443 family protein [Acidobacteriaceae bacterium]
MNKLGLLLVLGSLSLLAACGSSSGNNSGTITSVSVSCTPSTIASGQTSQCSASVNGTGNFSSSVSWSSSPASAGSITSSGLFSALFVTASMVATVTATSTQDSTKSGTFSVTVNPTATGSNVAPLIVDAGPDPANFTSANVAFVTVTVCVPGTSNCQTIDHVQVDTGSSGLRILSSVLTLPLPAENDSLGNPLDECLVFADGFVWGPIVTADITVGGEKASDAPVQVLIPGSASPPVPNSCSSQNPQGGAGNEGGSVDTFGANAIIGVGLFQPDCGEYCVTSSNNCNSTLTAPCIYYDCPPSGCSPTLATLTQQVPNPVAEFPADNNGVLIQLQSVGDGGTLTASGNLIFGIGTESNNALGGATVYPVPDSGSNAGDLITTFNGQAYSQSFLDSGSNGYFFADSSIPTCASPLQDWYCPATSPDNLSATNQGQNTSGPVGSPVTVDFSIENTDNLFNTNNTAFSTLAGPVPSSLNGFDWGLSFFFGKNVFTAIDNASTPGGTGPYFAY